MKSIAFVLGRNVAACFLSVLLINMGGMLWALSSVRFIATTTSLILGAAYAAFSLTLIWVSSRRNGATRKEAAIAGVTLGAFGLIWTGQPFIDTQVAIIDGKDRGVYEQQSSVHG